jgi:putative IMPACT (imprinted ancient) family translation regulator
MLRLAGAGYAELEVKKSRFLASATALESETCAETRIRELSDPDARHNCWAWRCGQAYRFFDAGEPGGTAGRPILAAIDGAQLDHVLVVVTRHFGGIKLGTGGLVRAYGKAAAMALKAAPTAVWRAMVELHVRIPVARRSVLEHQLTLMGGCVLAHQHEVLQSVLTVRLPEDQLGVWRDQVQAACAGRAVFSAV